MSAAKLPAWTGCTCLGLGASWGSSPNETWDGPIDVYRSMEFWHVRCNAKRQGCRILMNLHGKLKSAWSLRLNWTLRALLQLWKL